METLPRPTLSGLFALLACLLLSPLTHAITDTNQNQISDIFERHFNGGNLFPADLSPQSDADKDGFTLIEESIAWTDPFENQDYLCTPEMAKSADQRSVTLTWPSLLGKKYTLLFSDDLAANSWNTVDDAIEGSGRTMSETIPILPHEGRKFWRLQVEDFSTDNDALTDFEELRIGSSIYFEDTNNNGIDDAADFESGQDPTSISPENELYMVEFEILHERHSFKPVKCFDPITGNNRTTRYQVKTDTEEYSVSDSARYSPISNGLHTTTHVYDKGPLGGTSDGIQYHHWLSNNRLTLAPDEYLQSQPEEKTTQGPINTVTESYTTKVYRTPWRVMKSHLIARSGTEILTVTNRTILTNPKTVQDMWNDYLIHEEWRETYEGRPQITGPYGSEQMDLIAAGDAEAAQLIESSFRDSDLPFGSLVCDPSFSYGIIGGNERIKSLRWRWLRFNPLNPFEKIYAAPPADYRLRFYFMINQRNSFSDPSNPASSKNDRSQEGIVEIECRGSDGSGWHEVSNQFDSHMLDRPLDLNSMNFDCVSSTERRFNSFVPDLKVDADRDGRLLSNDETNPEKPFRFWINNDQDDVEVDEPVTVDTPDSEDETIATKRDLEDFTRLRLLADLPIDLLKSGTWRLGLRFKETGGDLPAIRVWPNESTYGADDYLKKDAAAARQIAQPCFGNTATGTVYLPASYWQNHISYSAANVIFEGVSKGKGELVLVMHDTENDKEYETASIHLHLLDVREMYERARIVNEADEIPDPWVNDNPPAQTWRWDPWDWEYDEDPDAEETTAIFVHGWRMTYDEYLQWSQTTYKRLWHQGFKGKFYSFRWATFSPSRLTYNASEYRAWLCGPALASWVNSLPNAGRRSLFAHSMGNVISGAALRTGMSVQRYALCNAAMAAMAYDSNPNLRKDQNGNDLTLIGDDQTPDNDPISHYRNTFGLQNKFNNSSFPRMFNFGLPEDFALGVWTLNNHEFKPEDALGYFYGSDPFQRPTWFSRVVTSIPEAMGYVTKSLTRPAGSDLRTGSIVTGFQNMANWSSVGNNHGSFGEEHSAQWTWNNQSTNLFWKKITETLSLK